MPLFYQYSLIWSEFFFLLLGLALIRITGGFPFGALDPLWALGRRIARRPRLAVALSFALPILLRLLAWPVVRVPTPTVHDEFSFLFMADTFGHGRLTNPSHPLWLHFETIHILQHPTYASIYPVMQGAVLAVGQTVFHHPWVGVMLSVGLMCAAICWALQAWLPPFWAFAGAVLAAVRLGVFSYWMNSYWGGAAAALGGALVLGALPRILRRAKMRDAILLAVGMAVLANSRPFEGFFLCIPVAIVLVAWIFGAEKFCRACGLRLTHRPRFRDIAVRVIVPVTVVLILAAVFMGYYFWRVTGDPLTMPYVVEARQYGVTPLFIWQKLRPAPTYNDDRLRYFYTQWATFQPSQRIRWFAYWAFYLGPALTLPLLMLPGVLRDRRTRFLWIAVGVAAIPLVVEWWAQPHYAAPATVALYGLVLQGVRHLRCAVRHSRWRKLVALVPAAVLAMVMVRVVLPLAQAPVNPQSLPTWGSMYPPSNRRFELERRFKEQGGKHLVLIRYRDHSRPLPIHNEWVYNAADIDQSQVVWARELDEEHNRRLLEYFKDRQVWVVDPDLDVLTPLH